MGGVQARGTGSRYRLWRLTWRSGARWRNAAPGGGGNLVGIDRQFETAGDDHLRSISALLRAGTLTPVCGLAATDIEGLPRNVARRVAIGAYENADAIFANGFDPD